jgi:superfamily I DNA/RNA helicase
MITLSPHQAAAATSPQAVVEVVAGAGSGKTAVIVERYRHMLSTGDSPKSVVVITFTVAAGNELKRRIEREGLPSPFFVGTIHSFCASLLPKTNPGVSLTSEAIAAAVMEKVKAMFPKDKLPDLDRTRMDVLEKNRIYAAYRTHMANAKLVDFRRLVVDFGKSEAAFEICRHLNLIIDEYQDTTDEERALVKLFNTFFLVGDPRQQLYQFRGVTLWAPVRSHAVPVSYRVPDAVARMVNEIPFPGLEPMVSHSLGGCVKLGTPLDLPLTGSRAVLCRSNREVEEISKMLTSLCFPVIKPVPLPEEVVCYSEWLDALLHPNKVYVVEQWLSRDKASLKAAQEKSRTTLSKLTEVVVIPKYYPLPKTQPILDLEEQHPDHQERLLAIRQMRSTLSGTDGVRVSTIHGFKGLEADHVCVVVPEYLKDTPEDRCLMYVAMTRTKHTLILQPSKATLPPWMATIINSLR